ncbi:ATP-dependent helicase [Candidatus Pacearchaeota archaeon]|nr:ATP-dependent helicase [Candidatus Pacearchaeota archaeon]
METKQLLTTIEKIDSEKLKPILNPLVKEWFFNKFKDFSDAQLYGVMSVHERKNILISAPTGSGKTLTSFLAILNYLVGLAEKNELEDKVYCVYSSPLKALNNDIFVNLIKPLEEIYKLAEKKGIKLQKIRVGLRTGDTKAGEKTKMLKNPPHIFVTTPESLAIVLTTKKFIDHLNSVEFIIIDEIHSLGNKRGVYLSVSLERLEEISKITPVRIGLSATVAPLEKVANFLVGVNRECLIAEVQTSKKIDIKVLTSVENLIDTTGEEIHYSLYTLIDKLIQEHRTTLIFTNTRAATERVIHHLKEMFPENYLGNTAEELIDSTKSSGSDVIGAHHSALSKEYRFEIEDKLRKGELKVVVSSTSLELGIDIGYIDLVILLGSPKSSARAIQRIGRAGHKLHDISKGRFIVTDRDDLVECSILNKECHERKIDKIHIPQNCLDVLSQQIFGMCIQRIWNIDEMFQLIRKSYCYRDLTREDFMSVISYLAGEYALEHRNVYAKIWYDAETKQIGKKGKLARVIYLTNIGTIPEESFITIVIGSGERKDFKVGVVDEAFLEKMKPGDVFVLGGKKYQFMYTRGMKAYVVAGVKKNPTIPSWFSEMLPLSFESAMEIQRFRKLLNEKFEVKKSREDIIEFIKEYCYCDNHVAKGIYNYFNEQFRYSKISHEKRLIIEQYKGEKNYLIFHFLFGRRINDALSRALGYLMAQKVGRDIEIGISDNGFYFAGEQLPIDEAMKVLKVENLREILEEAISKTEILKRRFRHCAARSLMILRNYKGRVKSVGKQQMNSFFLLNAINKLSKDFPILKEARREVLEDLMDIGNTELVLKWLKDGNIKIEKTQTKLPSPFAMNLILQGYSDLLKMEDRIEFMKRIHKEIVKEIKDKED